MKTLYNYVIVYDDECPLCRLYTHAFVRTGMLEKSGRLAFQQMPEQVTCKIDKRRAVDEIALVNSHTGEVLYGVNSLLRILGNERPLFQLLFQQKALVWVAQKLYKFVSFNRRVIVPATGAEPGGRSCAPSFNIKYRLFFLLFTWLVTSFILLHYSRLLTPFIPETSYLREFLICGGQILWQGGILALYRKKQLWEYLGNMMTISLAGALLLGFLLIISLAVSVPAQFALLYFLAVAGLMFLEHLRRAKLLGLGLWISASWVLYRILILLIII